MWKSRHWDFPPSSFLVPPLSRLSLTLLLATVLFARDIAQTGSFGLTAVRSLSCCTSRSLGAASAPASLRSALSQYLGRNSLSGRLILDNSGNLLRHQYGRINNHTQANPQTGGLYRSIGGYAAGSAAVAGDNTFSARIRGKRADVYVWVPTGAESSDRVSSSTESIQWISSSTKLRSWISPSTECRQWIPTSTEPGHWVCSSTEPIYWLPSRAESGHGLPSSAEPH